MVAPHKNRQEKQQLLAIITKFESIIDSRKADRKTIAAKRKAWIQISSEFNRLPNVRPCNASQLKRFWSNLKARDLQVKKLCNDQSSRTGESGVGSEQFYVEEDEQNLDDIALDSSDSETPPIPVNKTPAKLKRKRIVIETPHSDENNTECLSSQNKQLNVNSVINAQMSKMELSMENMRELHQLAVQREKLQVRLLEQQIEEQAILHQFRLDNEREIHQMRLKHEQELHLQRMRFEQEQIVLQQGKIHEVHGYAIR